MSTANVRVSPIRGTAAAMTRNNIVLLAGEQGYETDTGKTKRGDGSTAWNSLPYDLDAASVSATYVALAQIPIALDVDGVPYFANGSDFTNAVPLKTDTDGVPYLAA